MSHRTFQERGAPSAECIRLFPRNSYDRIVVIAGMGEIESHVWLVVGILEIVYPYGGIGVDIDDVGIEEVKLAA